MNRVIVGDCLKVLPTLEPESVQCVVTSPPYWGLRDYGVSGQLGLEETPEEYVDNMVSVFREVWRVLKKDGTLWLNLGDSYTNNSIPGGGDPTIKKRNIGNTNYKPTIVKGLKPKNLIGIPWRVAFALQKPDLLCNNCGYLGRKEWIFDRGTQDYYCCRCSYSDYRQQSWYLRQDIIWSKPNPMPESVKDRCTKSHEYLFLLTKSAKYYYDADAIKEPAKYENKVPAGWQTGTGSHDTIGHNTQKRKYLERTKENGYRTRFSKEQTIDGMRNKHSVWEIATHPYSKAHFATFPPKLVEPCILAGSRPNDLVLDPFSGSGTVGQVCADLCRNYIGIELNPEYAEMRADERSKLTMPLL